MQVVQYCLSAGMGTKENGDAIGSIVTIRVVRVTIGCTGNYISYVLRSNTKLKTFKLDKVWKDCIWGNGLKIYWQKEYRGIEMKTRRLGNETNW